MSFLKDALRSAWRRVDKFFSVDISPDPVVIAKFQGQRDVAAWRVFSDSAFGGRSNAALQLSSDGKHAVFSGRYSKLLQEGSSLVRAGYCGMNNVRTRSVNLELHDGVRFRVRGDGNTYIASLRTEQYTGGDEEAWQAPLPTKPDVPEGQWEEVVVPFTDFIFTFRGRLVKNQAAFAHMLRHKVSAVGVTLSASHDMPDEGDFRLEIKDITAECFQLSPEEASRKAFAGYLDPLAYKRRGSGDDVGEESQASSPSSGIQALGHARSSRSSSVTSATSSGGSSDALGSDAQAEGAGKAGKQ